MHSVIPLALRQVGGKWLVVGAEKGACVVGDDQLSKACTKFGPGCLVVDLSMPALPEEMLEKAS